MDWQLAEAKNRFSEVVRLALAEGPQRVYRRSDAVVVVAAKEFDRLTGHEQSFVEFLMEGPSLEEVDLTRDSSPMRDVDL